MRGLSDTISRLAALKAAARAHHAPPEPGRLSPLTGFNGGPGGLNGWTYLPPGLKPGAPLVVVLHGCTQSAAGYDQGAGWSRLADRCGFALLFPEQTRGNNPNLCFNWFLPGDTRRGVGEAGSIALMIEGMVRAHALDKSRIFITGLSAGGAMAATMLASYPELFAGGAVIAGLPHGVAHTVPEAFERMRGSGLPGPRALHDLLARASDHPGPWPKLSVWHGTADQTVAVANMEALVEQWRGVHGISGGSERRSAANGHLRRAWVDPAGREVIEAYTITGMGHGTPLATLGPEGLGAAGPFMLEVGLSSTLRSAQFWGIAEGIAAAAAEPGATRTRTASMPAGTPKTPAVRTPVAAPRPRPERVEQDDNAAGPVNVSKVGRVIEDALRKAGLMR